MITTVAAPPLRDTQAMDYADSILDLVGRTPLVRLSGITPDLGPVECQPLVLDPPLTLVGASATLDEAVGLLSNGAPALVVVRDGLPVDVVARLDLLESLACGRGT